MQVIHVLCDDRAAVEGLRPLRDDVMGGIGGAGRDELAPPGVPLPDEGGIPAEGTGCRQVLGPELPPESPIAAEGRDPARRGHSGAGQYGDAPSPPEAVREQVELFVAHEIRMAQTPY